uniref:Metallo-beta-lactamase domain-containing protein n=1 Tax=Oncorhynchus tshawytscha TaxID=74940 RepID=A0A8C8LUJ6_ONCTS
MAPPDWSVTLIATASFCSVLCLCLRFRRTGRTIWKSFFGQIMARTEKPLFRIAYTLYTRTKLGYMYYKRQMRKAREQFPTGHSRAQPMELNGIKIMPISVLSDNYSYLVIDMASSVAVVVDPADPQTVQAVLEEEGVMLEAILCTHKHWDHSGGNKGLKKLYSSCRVYGNATDNIPGLTHPLTDKDSIDVGRMHFKALFTPGHTVGHMIYLLDGRSIGAPSSLFSGDLVFLSGCGHEYAEDNLMFAAEVEPHNAARENKYQWVLQQRGQKLCTSPSTIGEEKEYNPFLRIHSSELHQALGLQQDQDEDWTLFRARVLEELRRRKDIYKGR